MTVSVVKNADFRPAEGLLDNTPITTGLYIAHIAVPCRDLEEAARWYAEVLGAQRERRVVLAAREGTQKQQDERGRYGRYRHAADQKVQIHANRVIDRRSISVLRYRRTPIVAGGATIISGAGCDE